MATKSAPKLIASALYHCSRPHLQLPQRAQFAHLAARHYAHAIPKPPRPSIPANSGTGSIGEQAPAKQNQHQNQKQDQPTKPRKLLEPHYELTFTCVPCGSRSAHTVSKQGYHQGSVLISCPTCRNRHIISDHLCIFGDRKNLTVEDLMRERGQLVKRGTLGEDQDIEFWEDGTTTRRSERGDGHEAQIQREIGTREADAAISGEGTAGSYVSPLISAKPKPES